MVGIAIKPDPPTADGLGSVPLHVRPLEVDDAKATTAKSEAAPPTLPALLCSKVKGQFEDADDDDDKKQVAIAPPVSEAKASTTQQHQDDSYSAKSDNEAPGNNTITSNSNPLDFLVAACNQADEDAEQPQPAEAPPSIPKPVPMIENQRRVSTTTCAATRSLLQLATSVVSLTKDVPCKTAIGGKRKAQKSWQTRFEELVDFKKRYGHVNLRQDSKSSESTRELAAWLANSRCRYRAGKLNPERSQKLHQMGCEGFCPEDLEKWRRGKESSDTEDEDASMTGSERQENNMSYYHNEHDDEYEEEEDTKPTATTISSRSVPDRDASLEERIMRARAMAQAMERRSMPAVANPWGGVAPPRMMHPSVQALMEGQRMMHQAPVRRRADPDGELLSQTYPEEDGGKSREQQRSSSMRSMEHNNPPPYPHGALSSASLHHGAHSLPPYLSERPGMSLLQPLQTVHTRMDPLVMQYGMQQHQQQQQAAMQALAREHLLMQQRASATTTSSQNIQPPMRTEKDEEEEEFALQLQRQQAAARASLLMQRRSRASASVNSRDNTQPTKRKEEEMPKKKVAARTAEDTQSEGDEESNSPSTGKKPRFGKRGPKKTWTERMMEMREYFLNFGHIQVPTRGPHRELGRWLSCTRGKARAGTLKPERLEEYLSMKEWTLDQATAVAFGKPKAQPLSMRRADPPEEGSVSGYRYSYNDESGQVRNTGKDSEVTPEGEASDGIKKRKRTRHSYSTRVEHIKEFKEKYGHCDVSITSKDEFEEQLGRWLISARCRYRMGQLQPERVEELRQLGCAGFEPHDAPVGMSADAIRAATPSPGPEDGSSLSDGDVTGEGSVKRRKRCKAVYQTWDEMFEELRAYLQIHGDDAPVPKPEGEGGKLGRWLAFQRRLFLAGTLQSDRLAKLKGLGRPEFKGNLTLGNKYASTGVQPRPMQVQ